MCAPIGNVCAQGCITGTEGTTGFDVSGVPSAHGVEEATAGWDIHPPHIREELLRRARNARPTAKPLSKAKKMCPPLNDDKQNGGRCGPQFGGKRCNKNLADYALYCNMYNGWCGSTIVHKNSDMVDMYDFDPVSCKKECTVEVLSVDHASGVEGKYFNFDKKELDAILGRSDWSNERLKVGNKKVVAVWRNPNGGSKGDAHGRYDPKLWAQKNDWSVGDKVT